MRHIWLIVIPAIILGYGMTLRDASGPFWAGNNLDPAYAYLMNSLSLSQGLPVGHSDHPGSTLQWAGAIWLYGINVFLGNNDLVTDVLAHPEMYLAHIHRILLIIIFFTLMMAGWFTLRWTGDRVAAILIQLGIFIGYTARHELSQMSPEPLLLIFGLWFAMTILFHRHQVHQDVPKEPYWQYGIIAGLGMGLKITFLPLCILPLILLNRIRHRFLYLGISGMVFFALTANPLMEFNSFNKFLFDHLIARDGYNRPLVSGSSNFQAMIDGFSLLLANLWQYEKPLLILAFIFVATAFWILIHKSNKENSQTGSWTLRLWIGLLLTLAGQLILVANGPRADLRYLTPVLGLTGLLAVMVWRWLHRAPEPKFPNFLWGKVHYLAIIGVISVLTFIELPGEIGLAATGTKHWQEANQFKTDNALLNETTVYYYRASGVQFALSFGNNYAQQHFSHQLATMYPKFFHFHRWTRRLFSQFSSKQVTLDELVTHAGTVLIQGQVFNPINIPALEKPNHSNGKPTPAITPSSHIIPIQSPNNMSASVIFQGDVEWIVLLQSRPHQNNTENSN